MDTTWLPAQRLYLAGPMSGLPDHNFPAFTAAAERLRELGWLVVNPAELDAPDHTPGDWPWERYMRRDVRALLGCSALALLPGWRASRGASLEAHVATELGMDLFEWTGTRLEPLAETVLEEAQRLIYGPRQGDYGHPAEDFARTGRMWGAILGLDDDVTPEQVGLCMVAVKLSREVHAHKRDNLVDGCGYLGTVAMIHEAREE